MILHGVPKWDPTGTTETAAPTLWVDPSDSTTLLNTTGGAITNGATVGTCTSKDATHFAFTQWGTNGRPTWDSTGIHGLGSLRCNSQILTTTTTTGWTTLSGATFMLVCKYNSGGTGAAMLGFTMIDPGTGKADISMVQMRSASTYIVGGRRLGSDSIAFGLGDSIPADSVYVLTGIFDYSNAKLTVIQSGVMGIRQQTFQTSGTTAGTEPHYISIGGFAQESAHAASMCDGWAGEILGWNSALTPDQCVSPQTYLRLKWGIN